MTERNLTDYLGALISFSFLSNVMIGFSLILYGAYNDYGLFEINRVAEDFLAQGLIGSWVIDVINLVVNMFSYVPALVDMIWLGSFLLLSYGIITSAYESRRENYLSALGMLTYGVMVILFLSTIFIELSAWFQTEIIDKILPTLTNLTPFFSFYIDHIGIINGLLIVIAILVNVIDFDFASYSMRKNKEVSKDEAL